MVAGTLGADDLRARLVDLALDDLVRARRTAFAPLWSVESWAKFLIWMALRCGSGPDREALEAFAMALGEPLSARLRQQFFSREEIDQGLRLLADPAQPEVLLLAIDAADTAPDHERAAACFRRHGLSDRLDPDPAHWRVQAGVLAVPWAPCS
jgi:hypothetical protein